METMSASPTDASERWRSSARSAKAVIGQARRDPARHHRGVRARPRAAAGRRRRRQDDCCCVRFARVLGGAFARIEGTIDLMPADLVYYTYINADGRPAVEPGPLIRHGEDLAIFFFNEINRARPQVHALLLRVMAERSVPAFNREYRFPHLLVFADRNRVEREETFEISSAARDRFMIEVTIERPPATTSAAR